jgi:hypothetical protein
MIQETQAAAIHTDFTAYWMPACAGHDGRWFNRHCEPPGRANARPMTGSAKQSRGLPGDDWIASSLALLAMTVLIQ